MPFLRESFKLFIYLIVIVVGFSAYVCFTYMRPRRYISETRPEHLGLVPYDEVEFKTEDSITIKGWYVHAKNPTDKAIIVCHGYPMDKGNVIDLAKPFHDNYNILLFDFRGLGESGGTFTTIGLKETRDFNAAVSYLRDKGMKKIGALGFSMGGAVIIMANNPYVSAVVADSAFAELAPLVAVIYAHFRIFKHPFIYCTKLVARYIFRVDMSKVSPLKAIRDFKAPLLLIHSKVDSLVTVKNSELLHEACPHSELWIVPSALHGETHFQSPDEYDSRTLSFFEKNL